MDTLMRTPAPIDCARSRLDRDMKGLRTALAGMQPVDAARRFLEIASDLEREGAALRNRLLPIELEWTVDDRALGSWLRAAHGDLASLAYALHRALVAADPGGAPARDLMACALVHAGEAVKCGIGLARGETLDFGRMHSLMRWAIGAGHAHATVTMRHEGREIPCTLESLYWRALLLARFSGGALSRKQIEVLDAWLWLWMTVLVSARDAPAVFPLRADLDGDVGLKRGLREDPGPTLYLAQAPLDEAYLGLLAEFHAGRIVPSYGVASRFRIEDHTAVLDLLRREWRTSRRAAATRAVRHTSGRPAELLVGLPEIMRRGFTAAAPAAPALTLADADARPAAARDACWSIENQYELERRHVRVLDESGSGWGVEGSIEDCGSMAVGDLVALRIPGEDRIAAGRVARTAASKSAGRIVLGVRKVADTVQQVNLRHAVDDDRVPMLFVPGSDGSGRNDAYLVPERTYERREPLLALLGGVTFSLRLNRIRERGRGWILAGFEVTKAQPG